MKRSIIVLLGTLLLLAVVVPAAFADGGPHGGYTDISAGLPDQCAACHRVHQGQTTGKLLKAESPYALCLTCHNGAGSRLDVLDGVKLGANQSPNSAVVRAADTVDINVSVAPTTLFYAPLKTGMGGAVADDGGVQVDETTASNNVGADDMTLLPTVPVVNDAYYFGGASRFSALSLNVSTAGVGTWAITWEYYNGAAWGNLSPTDGTTGFTVSGTNEVRFQVPTDWAVTTIKSIQLYWIRARVSAFTAVTTPPKGQQSWVGGFPQESTVAVRFRASDTMGGAIADDGGVQVNETAAANSTTANDMTLLPAVPAVSDAYYLGNTSKFSAVNLTVGTAGAGTWTIVWEYWNGAAWVALSGVTDGTSGLKGTTGAKVISFTVPGDWATTAVATLTDYWVRARVSAYTAVTTQPKGTQATVALTAATVALAVNADSNASAFYGSYLKDASLSVPAPVGGIPGVAYTILSTRSKASAVANDSNLTTVRGTYNSLNADVIVQTRVGDSTALGVLNGGGFKYIAGVAITSRHNADPADNSLYPWGYNANTGQNTNALSSPLQCTSCHNPHGTANYRLLKETVNLQAVVVRAYYSAAFTKDEGGAGLTSGLPADKYTKEYYGSAGTGGAPTTAGQGSIASLCGACHTAYPSSGASVAYTAGGATHYRHKTEMPYTDWTNPETGTFVPNNPETSPISGFPALRLATNAANADKIVTCLTCHRVHGSTSTMSGYALKTTFGGLGDTDLTPSQTALSISTLLYTNNRGMCEACHQW